MSMYDNDLPKWQNYIRKADTNEEMKNIILKFDMQWGINITPATRIFYMKCLKLFATYFKDKRPEEITKDDLIVFFNAIKGKRGERMIEQTKSSVKKFFKEFYQTEEYPDLVKWIKPTRKLKPAVTREMLVTEEEVKRMIEVCDDVRDRAFITMLLESACRLGELINIKLCDIIFGENCTTIIVNGKTGMRRVPLIHCVPYLKDWLNQHPLRSDDNAPLWVCTGRKNFGKPIMPNPMRSKLKIIAKRAGIKKRIFCHLFRHTQLTELIKNGYSELYLKKHAGWTASSKMATVYSHLAFDDVEQKYLEMNGILPEKEKKEPVLRPKKCARCNEVNPATNRICNKCLCVLDLKTALELEEKRKQIDELMNLLILRPRVRQVLEEEVAEIENERLLMEKVRAN